MMRLEVKEPREGASPQRHHSPRDQEEQEVEEHHSLSLPSSPFPLPFPSPLLSSLSTLHPLPYSLSLLLVQIVLSTFMLWPL